MKNPVKLFGATLLLLLLLGVGAWGWAQYRVSSGLDDLVQQAAPFASISYDSVFADPRGWVTVDQVTVLPRGAGPFTIDRVRVEGPGPGFVLWGGGPQDDPPERLRLHFVGVGMDLDSGVFRQLQSDAPQPCELGGVMGPDELRDLGLQRLEMDLDIAYDFDKQAARFTLDAGVDMHGMQSFAMAVEAEGLPAMSPGAVMTAPPRVRTMEFRYLPDPDYQGRALDYCAQRQGVSREDYVAGLIEAPDSAWVKAIGLVPGVGIRDAVRRALLEPGEVVLRMRPAPDFNFATVQAYALSDLVDRLGVALMVNGQPVGDLSFRVPQTAPGATAGWPLARWGGPSEDAESAGTERRSQSRVRRTTAFRPVPASDLRRYLYKDVRLYMQDGTPIRSGTLVALNADVATVEQRVHSGKFTAHVQLADIDRVEVKLPVEQE